jgi:glucokinase
VRDVLGMVVSTGVGGGLIVGGVPVRGKSGNAGFVGAIGVGTPEQGSEASSLEQWSSGIWSVTWAREQGWTGTTGEQLVADAAAGLPIPSEALRRSGAALGRGIAAATALLDLELVTIGGGFSQAGAPLFDGIRAVLDAHHLASVRAVRVVPSSLGGEAPLIGAASLVLRPEYAPPGMLRP